MKHPFADLSSSRAPAQQSSRSYALGSLMDAWRWFARLGDVWFLNRANKQTVKGMQRQRLAEIVAFARTHSRYYARLYRDVPDWRPFDELPVVRKHDLMANFDEWVTDPDITRAGAEQFISDPARIGSRFLDRYLLWTSSGTTGEEGYFVQDGAALAVYDALTAVRFGQDTRGGNPMWQVLGSDGHAAFIGATSGHFAGIVSWMRMKHEQPWLAARMHELSVLQPIAHLVNELNRLRPAFISSYPTVLALLAEEATAGRLTIRPVSLWAGGETLTAPQRALIERVFGVSVVNDYGASEFMNIAFGCSEGRLHVNADWVILEPVDKHYQPVAPGVASHTVLLTHLANRVQPLIRYDLGDSVTLDTTLCACGNPLPSIRVEGRRDETLWLKDATGHLKPVVPLALTTAIEDAAHVHDLQIVQTHPDSILLRLGGCHHESAHVKHQARDALHAFLASQGLGNVHARLDRHVPAADPRSGKVRRVCVVQASKNRRVRAAQSARKAS